jgi:hypothetical protein
MGCVSSRAKLTTLRNKFLNFSYRRCTSLRRRRFFRLFVACRVYCADSGGWCALSGRLFVCTWARLSPYFSCLQRISAHWFVMTCFRQCRVHRNNKCHTKSRPVPSQWRLVRCDATVQAQLWAVLKPPPPHELVFSLSCKKRTAVRDRANGRPSLVHTHTNNVVNVSEWPKIMCAPFRRPFICEHRV